MNFELILTRTDSNNADYIRLVTQLDADLRIRDGDDHAFFAQFNKSDSIRHVVIAFEAEKAVGCGAIKEFDQETMEVKRMFVDPEYRGKQFATHILRELERWTEELGYNRCILETGIRQPEAIGLYKKSGYTIIPNYGQYSHVATSVCFEKILK